MKSKRPPQFNTENNGLVNGLSSRGMAPADQTKVSDQKDFHKISNTLAGCFSEEKEGNLRLKDEFSDETIGFVVKEGAAFLAGNSLTGETWEALRKFLENELWEFSRLKEELVLTDRKCGMIQQKASEASSPKDGVVSRNKVMACAMLLAETEMRRDHLQNRISMIIDEFVRRILAGQESLPDRDARELRLRAVFGSL